MELQEVEEEGTGSGTTTTTPLSAPPVDEQNETEEVVSLRIAVGSSNPSKLRAVETALQRAVDRPRELAAANSSSRRRRAVQLEIQGLDVASGVPDQPWGDEETKRGAQNRARTAYQEYRNDANNKTPHLAIGLEGGLEWLDSGNCGSGSIRKRDLFCMAWMAVYGKRDAVLVDCLASADIDASNHTAGDRKPVFGLAKTSLFPIPDAVAELVKNGVELGDADDQVFRRVKSKHGNGVVGILSDGLIDRSAYYEHAITLALLPWIRPDLYPEGN